MRRFSAGASAPSALLWPLSLRFSTSLGKQVNPRTAYVSGLALDDEAKKRMDCEVSFALSVRADYAGILEYVRACGPELVVLTHCDPGGDLYGDLQALGIEVTTVGPPLQMALF